MQEDEKRAKHAEANRKWRQRKNETGLVRVEVWVPEDCRAELQYFVAQLVEENT